MSTVYRPILTAAMFLAVTLQVGANPYDAAGIIAYSKVKGQTYVLLADHRDSDRGWGTFGGRQKVNESLATTASREFREETQCVYDYPSAAELSGKPTVAQENFLSYVVEVPFVSTEVFERKSVPADCTGPDYKQRGPWIWIPLDELIKSLEDAASMGGYSLPKDFVPKGCTTRLWSNSATIIRKALSERFLQ